MSLTALNASFPFHLWRKTLDTDSQILATKISDSTKRVCITVSSQNASLVDYSIEDNHQITSSKVNANIGDCLKELNS